MHFPVDLEEERERRKKGLAILNRKHLRVLFLLKHGLLGSTGTSIFWLNYSDTEERADAVLENAVCWLVTTTWERFLILN